MRKFIKKNNKSVSKFQLGGAPIYRKEIYLDKDPGGENIPHGDLRSWFAGLTPEERMDETVLALSPQVNPFTGAVINNTYQPTVELQNLKMIPMTDLERAYYNGIMSLITLPIQTNAVNFVANGIGKTLSFVPKVGPILTNSPRAIATTAGLGLGASSAYADYNTYVDNINNLDKYLTGLHNFTPTDLENLRKVYKDDYLNLLFGWMNAFNYNVQALDGENVYDIVKNARDLSITDPKSWIESGWINWEDPVFLAYMAANNIKSLSPGKRTRIAGNIIAPVLWAGMKAYRFNDIQQNLKRERILNDIISVLRGLGFIINGSSTNLNPYSVQTNPQGQPQLSNAQSSDTTVRDSAATPVADEAPAVTETERVDWNGKLGSTIDSIRQQ